MEENSTWIGHPSGGEESLPSAPERKNRMGRLMRPEPVGAAASAAPAAIIKPRSVSLSRTEDCSIREVPIQPSDTEGAKPSAGSSSVKLARSKSSVEKKIQHEVAVFWRRTKEGKLFHKKESVAEPVNTDQVLFIFFHPHAPFVYLILSHHIAGFF